MGELRSELEWGMLAGDICRQEPQEEAGARDGACGGFAAPPSHSSISREGAEGLGAWHQFPSDIHTEQLPLPRCEQKHSAGVTGPWRALLPICRGPEWPACCPGTLEMPIALAELVRLDCVSV